MVKNEEGHEEDGVGNLIVGDGDDCDIKLD